MGSVAAPHDEAELAGASVLAEGGNALEAAVAVAATLGVVYPHMTGLGGDGFWLIAEPGKEPEALMASGPAAQAATPAWFRDRGAASLPPRGPAAALTVAGAVQGWVLALERARSWGGVLPVDRLVSDAVRLAVQGSPVSRSQAELTRAKASELQALPGFTTAFAPHGPPAEGVLQVQPRAAQVLSELAASGLDSFYRGDLARTLAADLSDLGSPVTLGDLESYRARWTRPLKVDVSVGTLYNLPPPTQGVSSLAILALFDRLGIARAEGFDHLHALVEATKRAFTWRNQNVGDPAFLASDPNAFLSTANLDRLARTIDRTRASPWPEPAAPGDTVWFGVVDNQGRTVSAIQSLYWEFGAGVVLPRSGLLWQNRGSSFTLEPGPHQVAAGRYPFHTLNPALARITQGPQKGQTIAYGTMGGEGQPQTQAAFLTRYAWFGQSLKESLERPRWVLGRTWGDDSASLRLESRVDSTVVNQLRQAGHPTEVLGPWDDRLGHAGAVVHHADGRTSGAHDPRADGHGLTLGDALTPWRLRTFLADLAQFGGTSAGVTRLLYDSAWIQARRWLSEQFALLGFKVRDDRVGNLYGRVEGTESGSVILTGSHFDTVRNGGWYDGAYGVAASTLAVAELVRRFGPPRRTVEVVAFCEEEGSRFPLAYWGSGHLVGRWPEGYGENQRDAEGHTLNEAMVEAGFGRQEQTDPQRRDVAAFLELHIEQGVVLERSGDRIGVVSAIVGQRRWLVELSGEANHAGTTPMGLRTDALAGAVEMMALVETEARRRGDPLVATVGFVELTPNTPNVIPGVTRFTVDARHTSEAELEDFCRFLESSFRQCADRRGLAFVLQPRLAVAPQAMDDHLQRVIRQACHGRNLKSRTLASGAGHDAQVMAALCPTAMIFVPSRRGISHSPLESSSHQALSDGLAVLTDALYELAWKGALP